MNEVKLKEYLKKERTAKMRAGSQVKLGRLKKSKKLDIFASTSIINHLIAEP